LLVAYDTGLRRSALLACRFDELDFDTRTLRVPAERMKNDCEQLYELSSQTIEAILATLPPRRSKLFPWPFRYERCLYDRYRRILRRAGLPHTSKDMFHKLRRTTASHLAAIAGEHIAIQQLGHRDTSCIGRYVDPRFTASHAHARHLPRPAWRNPRELLVESAASKPPAEPLPPVTVRYALADLRGEGEDVLMRLRDNSGPEGRVLTEDVNAALAVLGIFHVDFAAELGVTEQYLCSVLRGRMPMTLKLSDRIRVRLGVAKTAGRQEEDEELEVEVA
jgi:hypothetical protein